MPVLFETERLILRDWEPERDLEGAFAMYGDPEVMRFLGRNPVLVPDLAAMRERLDGYRNLRRAERRHGFLGDGEQGGRRICRCALGKTCPTPKARDQQRIWRLAGTCGGLRGAMAMRARLGRAGGYAFETLLVPVFYAVVKPENSRSIAVRSGWGCRLWAKRTGITGSDWICLS